MGLPISPVLRALILFHLESGESYRDISRLCGVSLAMVVKVQGDENVFPISTQLYTSSFFRYCHLEDTAANTRAESEMFYVHNPQTSVLFCFPALYKHLLL